LIFSRVEGSRRKNEEQTEKKNKSTDTPCIVRMSELNIVSTTDHHDCVRVQRVRVRRGREPRDEPRQQQLVDVARSPRAVPRDAPRVTATRGGAAAAAEAAALRHQPAEIFPAQQVRGGAVRNPAHHAAVAVGPTAALSTHVAATTFGHTDTYQNGGASPPQRPQARRARRARRAHRRTPSAIDGAGLAAAAHVLEPPMPTPVEQAEAQRVVAGDTRFIIHDHRGGRALSDEQRRPHQQQINECSMPFVVLPLYFQTEQGYVASHIHGHHGGRALLEAPRVAAACAGASGRPGTTTTQAMPFAVALAPQFRQERGGAALNPPNGAVAVGPVAFSEGVALGVRGPITDTPRPRPQRAGRRRPRAETDGDAIYELPVPTPVQQAEAEGEAAARPQRFVRVFSTFGNAGVECAQAGLAAAAGAAMGAVSVFGRAGRAVYEEFATRE
jgi:hypothetical protein